MIYALIKNVREFVDSFTYWTDEIYQGWLAYIWMLMLHSHAPNEPPIRPLGYPRHWAVSISSSARRHTVQLVMVDDDAV